MSAIRKASKDDAAVVTEYVIKLLTELRGEPFTGDRTKMTTCAAKLIETGRCISLVLETDREIIGLLNISIAHAVRVSGEYGILEELYIEPEYRSHGFGKELLDRAKEIARQRDWPRLEVGAPSLEHWRRTYDFYRANGFEEIGPRLKFVLK
ncbi:MAG: GNAT family N-acetyltransferase [Candidatus Zixiibacteriota bacterium]